MPCSICHQSGHNVKTCPRGGSLSTRLYQGVANTYRKVFCPKGTRSLYDGELHPLCANFIGPGTRIDIPEVRNAKPYNAVDALARQHDIDYENAGKLSTADARARAIHQADLTFIREVNKVADNEPYKTASLLGISGKYGLEQLYSLFKRKPSVLYGASLRMVQK